MLRKRNILLSGIVLLLASSVIVLQRCAPSGGESNTTDTNAYLGDQSCQSCHQKEYDDWAVSDHFRAMEPANDTTVLGNFNDQTYAADGITSRFFKKDGKFYINTQGEDGNNHDYEIQYTFGYKPLQQYLIAFPNGRLQVTRQSWDTEKKKWFHQYPGEKIPSHDWLHWTANAQNWNTMCSRCHSTDLQKNYDFNTDTYHTTYSTMTVSCESCHGPGKEHIDYIESSAYKKGKKVAGSYLLAGKNSDQTTIINTCAPCHARAGEISAGKINSHELLDDFIPAIPTTDNFYADGQMRDEVYNYTSFLQSKMYRNNVSCQDCHNPHSGKVYYTTNQLCLQCHEQKYDDLSHTFHAVNTAGAQCKNCHMPQTTYMGNDPRHDHSFRVPRPDLSVQYGTPNACNKCHTDKSSQWAADAVKKWYGPQRAYHFAEDLIPASKEDSATIQHVVRLMKDTSTPDIVTAAGLFYLKNIITPESAGILLEALQNEDAQVRYQALRSLSHFPAQDWQSKVAPLLKDKVRAVRIAAADLMITIPSAQIPSEYIEDLKRAKNELENYVLYQTDFATGNLIAGDFFLKQNDFRRAGQFYERAIKKDNQLMDAWLNLSVVYNLSSRNNDALKTLQQAAEIQPDNDRIYFNMALLYNELNDKDNAEKSLAKAADLHSENPRVYYNYGLILQQKGNIKQAVSQLQKAARLAPADGDIQYALGWLYMQAGQTDEARKIAALLQKLDPDNPQYSGFIRQFGY